MTKEKLILPGVRYPLGFTFSFPCKQEGLASARLSTWTKGFTCAGVVGQDVVKMLQNAIDEKVTKKSTSHLFYLNFVCSRILTLNVLHLSTIQLEH